MASVYVSLVHPSLQFFHLLNHICGIHIIFSNLLITYLVYKSFNKRNNRTTIVLDIQNMITLDTNKEQCAQCASEKAEEFRCHFGT